MTAYGLLVFDGAEELDFVGPWEVFGVSSMLRDGADSLELIAEREGPVRCNKGLRVLPDRAFGDSGGVQGSGGGAGRPEGLDVLLVPGGNGTRTEVGNDRLIRWLAEEAGRAEWVASVCTGALLLHEAGPAKGRRVATHWAFEEGLEARGGVTVVRDARYVVDGNLVTSQGVSAGIDMALWLVGRLHGRDHARRVRRYMQYEPAPPYMADEPLAG
ncbi:DJ-1/PfpI family protein [Nocardiopsis chromatogenes]|uniref:DJ-1/PfpI family protein n=1 Tax=Nocardiopsis chromatogenes TaxID=280239 RepID=UPI000349F794|nr:DJ-1/PfpI family protein [Nocardiopsis chromatogenes]